MLQHTQKILNKFNDLNASLYKSATKDFKPFYASYGQFEEIDAIYISISSLSQWVDSKVFCSDYDTEYATPIQVINDINDVKIFVDSEVSELLEYKNKYVIAHKNIPGPIEMTLKYYLDCQETLNYVLNLEEIYNANNPNATEKLTTQIKELRTQIEFDKKIKKARNF